MISKSSFWFNPPFLWKCLYQVRVFTVFTVFQLLTDFVCLYTYEFWLSLRKIVRSSVILLLPLHVFNELKSALNIETSLISELFERKNEDTKEIIIKLNRSTNITMAKRKREITMVHKTLCRKHKIDLNGPQLKAKLNSGVPGV